MTLRLSNGTIAVLAGGTLLVRDLDAGDVRRYGRLDGGAIEALGKNHGSAALLAELAAARAQSRSGTEFWAGGGIVSTILYGDRCRGVITASREAAGVPSVCFGSRYLALPDRAALVALMRALETSLASLGSAAGSFGGLRFGGLPDDALPDRYISTEQGGGYYHLSGLISLYRWLQQC